MPRLKVLTFAAAWLGMMLLGATPHAKSEPLIAVCPFDMAPEQRQSCVLGYAAMYEPGRTAASCQELWERESVKWSSGLLVRCGSAMPHTCRVTADHAATR